MDNMNKKSLKIILLLVIAMNLGGCSLFKKDESKTVVNDHDDQKKKKDKDLDKKSEDSTIMGENPHSINTGTENLYPLHYNDDKFWVDTSTSQGDSSLEEVTKTDFTTLHVLLVECKNIDTLKYTPKSVAVFLEALAHAESILNTVNSSQLLVVQEVQQLMCAKAQLTLIADFTILSEVIDEVSKIDIEKYTPMSMKNLEFALNLAKVVINDKNTTQAGIDEVVESMKEARKELVLRAYFNMLNETIKQAKLLKDEDYTDQSLSKMYHSLRIAEKIMNNLNASQSLVDVTNKDLQDKVFDLVKYITPDKTNLVNMIAQAKEYKENEYSVDSFATLIQKINQAEDTLNIKKVTELQINKAQNDLQEAIDHLGVDTTILQSILKNAKLFDENLYTPSTYQKLKETIESTEEFLLIAHKQFEVNAQETVLTDKINKLVNRANKKDLQKAIDDAEVNYTGDYTEETMSVLKSTVNDAKIVLNNAEATQEEVSNATKKLIDAIVQLKVIIHKENLQEFLDKVKNIKEEDYSPNTYAPFKVAYDLAIIINTNEEVTQKQVDDCVKELDSRFNNLVERANFTLLNRKIIDANAVVQDHYTDNSLVNFIEEFIKAKALVEDLNTTQLKVDEQLSALTKAMDNLVTYVVPNMNAINQAISNAEGIHADDWSSSSYNIMINKMELAKEAVIKKKVTQEEIDQAKNDLITAYDGLKVDTSKLSALLEKAKSYQEVNYTLDTFQVLQTAITKTENFLMAMHTQKEINTESKELQIAIEQLVLYEETDKTTLIATIHQVKAINANEYTPNSYNVLFTAITRAEKVKNNYRATINEINAAINELDSAKANLIKRANLTALNDVMAEAKTKYSGGFTTSSINILKAIVIDAETTLNNTNASQSEVDTKTLAIKTAITGLIKLGDKTALTSLINELDALQENDYTPVSWASASLGSVITDAKVIRDKVEATDDEVNTVLDALTQAKASLVKKADITELTNEITKAQAELSKGYTTASKDVLSKSISKAQTVVNNPNAIATEVSTALVDLRNAIAGLKVNVAPLVSEINIAKGTNTTNKLPSTVTILENAIKEAETYKDSASVTFEGMDVQIQKLKDAVNGLQDKTDTSTLITKLNEAKVLNQNDYTSESYAKVSAIINEVEQALLDENITIVQVTQLVSKLDVAMNGLEFVPTVASKRKECEQVIAQGYALLNDPLTQATDNYTNLLKIDLEFAERRLAESTDDELTIELVQNNINNIKEAMKNYNDNLYDVVGFIAQCRAKIAEARAMDTSGFSDSSVNSMLRSADYLEETIANGSRYVYLQTVYSWLIDAINDLAPADQTVYVNQQAPAEVLALLNAERAKLGLGQLTMDTKLCEATTIRATEAKDQTGLFVDWAHKRPDGRKWNTVLDEIGYHQSLAGENAASGYASGTSLYNGWINSQGHKDNMLMPGFTKVGISMIKVGEGQWISYMILAK